MAVTVRSEATDERKPRTLWDDLGSWFDESGQRWAHGANQIANWSDDVSRYLGGQPAAPISLTGLFRWLGSGYRGEEESRPRSRVSEILGSASGKRPPATRPVPGADQAAEMSFSDYLAMARQLMDESGGGGPDYSAAAEALRQQALQNDSRLAAMYNQLRGSIQADAPTIQGQYDQGISAVGQNADQAAGNVNAAYQEARDAQTRQLQALGIGDAAAVLAQDGNAAADQAHAVGNIEQGRATGQNQLTQNRASALNYNTNIGNAASLAGAETRSALATSLQNALAELAARQSQARAGQGQSILDLAFQLEDRDLARRGQGQPSPEDQQALAEFMYRQQSDASQAQRVTFMQLLEQYDGNVQEASRVFAQLQAAGVV